MHGKELLAEWESKGGFVFHGSGFQYGLLEPRQAYDLVDGKQIPDGGPAVFASSLAEYAIFMALINDVNCPKGHWASSGLREGALVLRASKETLQQLGTGSRGYVHVCARADFTERGGSEWVCRGEVCPLHVIEVGIEDLREDIGLLE